MLRRGLNCCRKFPEGFQWKSFEVTLRYSDDDEERDESKKVLILEVFQKNNKEKRSLIKTTWFEKIQVLV